ncbi:hypothetical protein P8H27_15245 [Pseudomonas sp. sp1636]|uniref:hypothetical protein n=1 Tax=Pseudomonas sp. sp1636 TaxID=3036707 RepID=UPI0025A4CD07|nr:hypothetical protein [Pseudomonas sp. sp1636]MDM8350234.1 hypothetical protein [Pseudomonas sp. sp1636]
MTHPDVQIETLRQHGRQLWQVRMGRRALTFHEELSARTFAAQLHMRLSWLRQQAMQENLDT